MIDVLNIFLYFIYVIECNIIVNDYNIDDILFCVVNVVWRFFSRLSLKEDDIFYVYNVVNGVELKLSFRI